MEHLEYLKCDTPEFLKNIAGENQVFKAIQEEQGKEPKHSRYDLIGFQGAYSYFVLKATKTKKE